MHNIEIGDVFITSNDIYKVVDIHINKDFPNDPYLSVETFVSGEGWSEERMSDGSLFGFTLLEANQCSFKHFKAQAE